MYARTGERVRNATCLSVAPAGTISIIAGTSGAIEPLFALAYRRAHTLGGTPLVEVNPTFLRYAATQGLDAERLTQGILTEGRLGELAGIPEVARRLFVTALEVPPRPHLRIHAAFQRYVDNAVSKTINLPEESSAEDVRDAYTLAWRLGLKGITVYRYGSRGEAVLSLGAGQEPLARELFTKCDPGACATPMAPARWTRSGRSRGLDRPDDASQPGPPGRPMPTLTSTRPAISVEVFPPKTPDGLSQLCDACESLAALRAEFVSVTCRPGPDARRRTCETVKAIRARLDPATGVVPHIIGVGSTRQDIRELRATYGSLGIDHFVVIRGDRAPGSPPGEFSHASELVAFIRAEGHTRARLHVAAHPEVHPEALSARADLAAFQRKVQAGADSAITQYVYSADPYLYFVESSRRLGVTVPIVPGIRPITNYERLARFSKTAASRFRGGSASGWRTWCTTWRRCAPSGSTWSAVSADICSTRVRRACISTR